MPDTTAISAAPLADLGSLIGLSDAALLRLCRANRHLRIERDARGGLHIMAPAGSESSERNLDLAAQLWAWNRQSGLGHAFDSSGGFLLPDGSMRAADVAWIANARWAAVPAEERKRFAPVCPDFVIELLSPSDSLPQTQAKMRDWLANGASCGLLIDPESRRVWRYRGDSAELFESVLRIEPDAERMPGFVLDLTMVFGGE
ncbi:MAG: Uma2 family endonuclease [Planctomycetota bacterium]